MFFKLFSFFIFSIFISISTFAKLPKGEIVNLSLRYYSSFGDGSVSLIKLDGFNLIKNSIFDVETKKNIMFLNFEEKSYKLDLNTIGISNFERVDFSNIHYMNNSSQIKFGVDSFQLFDLGVTFSMGKSLVICKHGQNLKNSKVLDQLLGSCLTNGSISLSSINYSDSKKIFVLSTLLEKYQIGKKLSLDKIKVNILNNKLKAEIKGSITKNVKVSIDGFSWYNLKKKEMKLKIIKVKAGFLNMTNVFFQELKKMESKSLKVEKPYMYISLKK